MTPLAEAIIDWDALLSVLWASVLGGIGVTAAFAFTILGATRAVDMRRDGRVAAAGAYGVLLVVAVALVIAAVVFGIVVMTSK
jgi:hypothetical protein